MPSSSEAEESTSTPAQPLVLAMASPGQNASSFISQGASRKRRTVTSRRGARTRVLMQWANLRHQVSSREVVPDGRIRCASGKKGPVAAAKGAFHRVVQSHADVPQPSGEPPSIAPSAAGRLQLAIQVVERVRTAGAVARDPDDDVRPPPPPLLGARRLKAKGAQVLHHRIPGLRRAAPAHNGHRAVAAASRAFRLGRRNAPTTRGK